MYFHTKGEALLKRSYRLWSLDSGVNPCEEATFEAPLAVIREVDALAPPSHLCLAGARQLARDGGGDVEGATLGLRVFGAKVAWFKAF